MFTKQPQKALFLGIMTILMWSTVASSIKLSLESLTPFQLIAFGFAVASTITFAILFYSNEHHKFRQLSSSDIKIILIQAILLFCYYVFGFYGYSSLPAQIASPINNSWPFALVFLSKLIFKDKIGKVEILGMFIAYSGVALVAIGGSSSASLGASVSIFGLGQMLIGTLFFATFWLVKNHTDVNHNLSLFLTFLFCSILGLVASLIENDSLADVTMSSIYAAIALGFFEWGIPFVTWAMALRLTNSIASIGILSFFTPFLALFWISILLGEPILPTTVFGLCLCVTGTFVQQKFKNKKNQI